MQRTILATVVGGVLALAAGAFTAQAAPLPAQQTEADAGLVQTVHYRDHHDGRRYHRHRRHHTHLFRYNSWWFHHRHHRHHRHHNRHHNHHNYR